MVPIVIDCSYMKFSMIIDKVVTLTPPQKILLPIFFMQTRILGSFTTLSAIENDVLLSLVRCC
jgi:hypothetical protein